MQEDFNFNFDKFIDDITRRENASTPQPQPHGQEELTAQREYIRRYSELPQNRINWER